MTIERHPIGCLTGRSARNHFRNERGLGHAIGFRIRKPEAVAERGHFARLRCRERRQSQDRIGRKAKAVLDCGKTRKPFGVEAVWQNARKDARALHRSHEVECARCCEKAYHLGSDALRREPQQPL